MGDSEAKNGNNNADRDDRIERGFVVGGYTFDTKEDADLAKEELSDIKYLSSKADYNDIGQVFRLYNNILDKKLFRTQVGMDYLKKLQQHLYKSKTISKEQIRPIPISPDTQKAIEERREAVKNKGLVRDLQKQLAVSKGRLSKSIALNIFLAIIIVAMMIITATGSNPNILNYETKLQDKYASWQEELDEREKEITQKEKELGIR